MFYSDWEKTAILKELAACVGSKKAFCFTNFKAIFKVTFANLFTNYQASHFSLYINEGGFFK